MSKIKYNQCVQWQSFPLFTCCYFVSFSNLNRQTSCSFMNPFAPVTSTREVLITRLESSPIVLTSPTTCTDMEWFWWDSKNVTFTWCMQLNCRLVFVVFMHHVWETALKRSAVDVWHGMIITTTRSASWGLAVSHLWSYTATWLHPQLWTVSFQLLCYAL